MPVTDPNGSTVSIPFHVVTGSGVLFLGNEICRRSNVLCTKNLIQVLKGLLSSSDHFLHTYSEPVGPRGTKGFRTYLSVVPSKVDHFRSYLSFCSFTTAHESLKAKFNTEEGFKRFATKLHTYSHLRVEYMRELCKRAGVYSKKLDYAPKLAVEKCSSSKGTGLPMINRSIALDKVLSSFNTHAQLDFFYMPEMGRLPILHLVDTNSGFSATAIVSSRDIDVAAKAIEKIWINVHGPPIKLSGDPEFVNNKFSKIDGALFDRSGAEACKPTAEDRSPGEKTRSGADACPTDSQRCRLRPTRYDRQCRRGSGQG